MSLKQLRAGEQWLDEARIKINEAIKAADAVADDIATHNADAAAHAAAIAAHNTNAAAHANANNAAKVWAIITVSGGTPTLADSYGVASITDLGVGVYRVTFTTVFTSVNYVVIATAQDAAGGDVVTVSVNNKTDALVEIVCSKQTGGPLAFDPASVSVVCFGDQ